MDLLKISVPRINVQNKGNLLAFADVEINECVKINGFSVIKGKNGAFVSVPQHKDNKTGKWYNDVYFSRKADYETLQKTVLSAYEDATK